MTKDPENPSVEPLKKFFNVDIEKALELTGYGKYNVALIFICGLSLFTSNSEAYSIGYIIPSAANDLQLDNARKGLLTSATFIGIMSSSLIWGYLSDVKGRRNLLILSMFLTFISSFAAPLFNSFWVFFFLRLLTGLCISGPSSIIFAFFGEFHNKANRSKGIALISLFIAFALINLPALGWLLMTSTIDLNILGLNLNSWKLFMVVNSIPNLIVGLALLTLPESPYYLYSSGQTEQCLHVLKTMFVINTGKPAEDYPVLSLEQSLVQKEPKSIISAVCAQIVPLFQKPLLIHTAAACLMQGCVFAISSGLFLWYPDIYNKLSGSESSSLTVCQALGLDVENLYQETVDSSVFIQSIFIGGCYLAAYALWGVLVTTLGNRNILIGSMVLSSSGIVALCFLSHKVAIDIIFIIVLTLPGICVAVINAQMVDCMPTGVCAMAVCITMTAGRFGSIVSSSIVGEMLDWNCTVTFLLYAASLIVCLLLSFVFPKHSKK